MQVVLFFFFLLFFFISLISQKPSTLTVRYLKYGKQRRPVEREEREREIEREMQMD